MDSDTLLTKDQLKEILKDISTGYIKPHDAKSHTPTILQPFKKLGVLIDYDDIAEAKETGKSEKRNLPKVNNVTQSQSYSCNQCRRRLPTAHLLDLHITEQHDLYFEASVERGDRPMYSCYIEECALKFPDPEERKAHCVGVHKFPANYRFDQKHTSVKCRKVKAEADGSMEVDKTISSNEVQYPYIKAFSFGHHKQRTFNTRRERGHNKSPLQDVQAMKEALNEME
ncbi:hypothetical protein KR222_009486 [Zaprionus bogoriensis]|nr:hypothetical protein KR222_009486 [Zaprionus bogoriensis]